jgi:hypothetical protein
MKTSVVLLSIFLVCSTSIVGQNYMGMSQSKIVKSMGEPDKIGSNFYIYNDLDEKGENIYYFDGNGNCNSFEIVRDMAYLQEYQKILKSEFNETPDNKYVKKTKKINYKAELILSSDKFQIKIQDSDTGIICNYPMFAGEQY